MSAQHREIPAKASAMLDCCKTSPEAARDLAVCQRCHKRGQTVPRQTMESLLTPEALTRLHNVNYYYDASPDCQVVYFSNEQASYFTKGDIRVRVGIKETAAPTPICYCFGHTVESARAEIEASGRSTVAAKIAEEIQNGNCACVVKNPSGRCCLGEVNRTIQILMDQFDAAL
jgi:hypothetical protein